MITYWLNRLTRDRRTWIVMLILGCVLGVLGIVATAQATGSPKNQPIGICHATGNGGYVYIEPDASDVENGHGSHSEDIIPPFTFADEKGVEHSYPGQGDQSILANKCEKPDDPPPPPNAECPEGTTVYDEGPPLVCLKTVTNTVTNTVYVDRPVEVIKYVDKIVYVDRPVEVVQYVEKTIVRWRVKTKVKVKKQTVIKWKTRTVVKKVIVYKNKKFCPVCPSGYRSYQNKCYPIVEGSG